MFTVTLLPVRPYRQLVAAGIAKVKPPSSGEAEDGADDGATSLLDPLLLRLQIDGIDPDQRSPSPDLSGSLKPAAQPSIGKAGVFRSVVLEGPAKRCVIESLGLRDAGGGKFDVINPAIMLDAAHGTFLYSRIACSSACGATAWRVDASSRRRRRLLASSPAKP